MYDLKDFKAADHIPALLDWMRAQMKGCGGKTAVVGISGGKDSSVIAALCVEAYGRENVGGGLAPPGIEAGRQTTVNLPSRIRMATLYAIAQSVDAGIVVNTSNLSEDWVGYCTIYGDSAGAFSPIGMYTTEEVIAIGRALGLPERFLIKPPSDGLTGKTDEDNLGFSYHAVNEYVRKGVADPAIKEQIDHKHRVSRFKFETIPVYHNGLPIVIEDGTDFYK